jgi:hypothetical protein
MDWLLQILSMTPWWVFLLFAVLLVSGVQALKPRRVDLRRIFITPAVFVAWALVSLGQAASASPFVLPAWLIAALAGVLMALITAQFQGLAADRALRSVNLPRSVLPLARNMIIFFAKYALAVAIATHPQARAELAVWDMAVSGLAAGYFVGWTIRFVLSYRRAAAGPIPAPTR